MLATSASGGMGARPLLDKATITPRAWVRSARLKLLSFSSSRFRQSWTLGGKPPSLAVRKMLPEDQYAARVSSAQHGVYLAVPGQKKALISVVQQSHCANRRWAQNGSNPEVPPTGSYT